MLILSRLASQINSVTDREMDDLNYTSTGTTRQTERKETWEAELLYDTTKLYPSQFLPQDLAI